MKYLCLIYDEEKKMGKMTKNEGDALMGEYGAFTEASRRAATISAATRCSRPHGHDRARRNGKVSTTDGPFAETKEQLGGYYLIEAKDLNDAIQVAARIPSARTGDRSAADPEMPAEDVSVPMA